MKILLTFLITAFTICAGAQSTQKFNFNLEEPGNTKNLSKDWFEWGDYELELDSINAQEGKYAAVITSNEQGGSFGSVAYKIPANYEGDSITLEGYMKIEEVKNGRAGLLLRIDGKGRSLVFDNMGQQNINGTRDWQKYSITLPYPDGGEDIYVAGIIAGKGKAWFDNFKVTIDGKDIQQLEEVERIVYKATLDREFDEGSNIDLPELNARNIKDLTLLGKVWGFLKYHHPEVAKGNYNWDYELFRILPKYLAVRNSAERDRVLITWIDKYSKLEKCETCQESTVEAFARPDHSWIRNSNMSGELQQKLDHIYKNRNQDRNFYVELTPGVGNPQFNNENAYSNMAYPDDGFRLLSLYKYWNMIHYFFPNKHLTDKDWNEVLQEYIPEFINAGDELAYEMATVKVIGEIRDTHANLWGGGNRIAEQKGSNYAPAHVRFIENKLVVTDFYNPELQQETGLEIGDVITHLNGKKVEDIVAELKPLYPASNEAAQLRDISADLLRSADDEVKIRFISQTGEQERALKLYRRDSLNMYHWYRSGDEETFRLLEGNIGYVTLESITADDIEPIEEQFRDTEGIIIDIRNYPSTFVPFTLGSYFMQEETPFVKFSSGNVLHPGEFIINETLSIPAAPDAYKGKLVILVNELSQSQAEYTAMAFRAASNATVVGSTTAGADGNVSSINLPGGLSTMISGIGVYYPDGTETQRVGIVPDVEVKPSIAGIREGRDELMEKAVEIIKAERERR